MPKPIKKPSWVTGVAGLTVVEPGVGKKAVGWAPDERPPAEYINWIYQNISDWIDYLDSVSGLIESSSFQFDAIVGPIAPGSPATHTSLAAALADTGVPNGARILITTDQTLTTPVVISKNFIEIVFLGGVNFIKGSGNKGLVIQGLNCRINGGRIIGYSTSGDKAIEIQAGAKNCMVRDVVFANCDIEVDDLAPNSSILGCITEE